MTTRSAKLKAEPGGAPFGGETPMTATGDPKAEARVRKDLNRGVQALLEALDEVEAVLLTGGYGPFNHAEKPHAHYVAEYLLKQGVDREDILEYAVSAHTVEDAVLSRRILEACSVGSICVVTSEVHIERARLIFEHFFDPRMIAFVATPDALPPDQLQRFRDHEADRIETIRKQGGIIVDGKLIRRKTEP